MTIHAYERDPYLTQLDVEVVATGDDAGRAFAVTDDTIFFPEGGGQPADHGRLGAAAVVDVRRAGGAIRHYLDAAVEKGPAALVLDWGRRFDHMQQHTAQHLLTATALARHGWKTTAFHLHADVCDIELDAAAISPAQLEALEEAVAAEIRADRPVTTRRVAPGEMAALGVRSRGLPAGHRGDVRLVAIEDIDLNTCGGTHVRSTGELETLKLLATEPLRGGTRLHWIAGSRVRRRLAAGEARAAELRKLLSTSDEDLVAVVALKVEQAKTSLRRQKALEARLGEAVAERLAAGGEAVSEAHFDDAEPPLLQQIAGRFSDARHRGAALLTATGPKGAFFVVSAGAESALDVQAAGRRVAAVLGGRGGGSGRVFQGKAASLARRDEALARLVATD